MVVKQIYDDLPEIWNLFQEDIEDSKIEKSGIIIDLNSVNNPIIINDSKYIIQSVNNFNYSSFTTNWSLLINEFTLKDEFVRKITPAPLNERVYRIETIRNFFDSISGWKVKENYDCGKSNRINGRELLFSAKRCMK
ncbi:MAG: hypothetical protein GY756_02630 [bacterium]|nr:hypothetical protein [bacterium]